MSGDGRLLLLGASGQLGTELARVFRACEVVAPGHADADLAQPETLRAMVRAVAPRIILNAAAYTAVDRAETEPELADTINHRAPCVLAEEAERAGALLVHYSTDYVFDGSKPGAWTENDDPAPLNNYGLSKLAGERGVAAACSRYLVLRTSWVYAAHGHNFLRTMLRVGRERETLRVVNDQCGAPTGAAALAQATRSVVEALTAAGYPQEWSGVYHATCAGQTTWHGFAEAIFAASRASLRVSRVEPIASAEYPTPALRPANSVMDNGRLWNRFNVRLPPWEQELHATLEAIGGRDA